MVRLAIFDCDGTLVDSAAAIHRALTLTLEEHGFEVPPQREARRVIGLSLTEAFALLAPHADAATLDALAGTYRLTFQSLRADDEVRTAVRRNPRSARRP